MASSLRWVVRPSEGHVPEIYVEPVPKFSTRALSRKFLSAVPGICVKFQERSGSRGEEQGTLPRPFADNPTYNGGPAMAAAPALSMRL
jgi:hypothetical protein